MQAHGATWPAFAEVAPDSIHGALRENELAMQRGGGADIRTPEIIAGTPGDLSEQFHGPVMRG